MSKTSDDEFNIFQCQLCASRPEFEIGPFKAHLTEVHGYTDFSGMRRATGHLDGAGYFQTDYEWRKDDVLFARQSVRCVRQKENR